MVNHNPGMGGSFQDPDVRFKVCSSILLAIGFSFFLLLGHNFLAHRFPTFAP